MLHDMFPDAPAWLAVAGLVSSGLVLVIIAACLVGSPFDMLRRNEPPDGEEITSVPQLKEKVSGRHRSDGGGVVRQDGAAGRDHREVADAVTQAGQEAASGIESAVPHGLGR